MNLADAMQSAARSHQAGLLADAETLYGQIIQHFPHYPDVKNLLGFLLTQTDRAAAGLPLIEEAIALDSARGMFHNTRGLALFALNRIPEAVAAYRRALELQPDFVEALNNLGNALGGLKQFDGAIAAYRRCVQLQPNLYQAHYNLANALRDAHYYDEAIKSYQRALQLKPDFLDACYFLARIFHSTDRPHDAIEYYQRAIAIDPDCVDAINNLGSALMHEGRTDDGIAAFRRALAIHPGYVSAMYNLSDALVVNGQFDDAVAIFDRSARPAAASIPSISSEVFAICSIRNGPVDLLPHWLEHYYRLGVDKILIGLFEDIASEARSQIDACAARWPCVCFNQTWKGTTEAAQEDQRRTGCRLAGARPETWILHSDLDELHEFPAPLAEIISAADALGIDVVSGWLLDHVAADGSLPPIRPAPPSLFEQFPVGCRLTARVLRALTRKVMLARFEIPVWTGHHVAGDVALSRFPLGRPEQYAVHHFKWHADLVPRLQWSLSQPNTNELWRREAEFLLTWLDANGGKIKLDECRA